MKQFVLVMSLWVVVFLSPAQVTFQKVFSADSAVVPNGIVATADGGYAIASGIVNQASGDWDVLLMKLSANGDTLWQKTFGSAGDESGYCLQQTSDNGYVIAGWTDDGDDILVIRTDQSGDTVWTNRYGGSYGDDPTAIRQTDDGGFIIVGATNSYSSGASNDIYLLKISVSGSIEWTKAFGKTGENDWGTCVQQTADNGYIISGSVSEGGYLNAGLIKTNATGDTLWTKSFGGTNHDYGESVVQTADGGYMLAGSTYSFGAGGLDFYLVKTDASGNMVWSKTYGGADYEELKSIQQTSDNGYIMLGESDSFSNHSKMYAIKINATGDTLWTKIYGEYDEEIGRALCLTADGGFAFTGYTYSFGLVDPGIFLIKTDQNGQSGCNEYGTQTLTGSPATQVSSGLVVSTGGAVNQSALVAGIPVLSVMSLCSSSAISEQNNNIPVTIYPNPATE
ncbi:MAG: hypothetical protein KKA07_17275, partial [Bacteroidetes bacterium]|nr:hypothetical protein [Bacteroidota bacterium]